MEKTRKIQIIGGGYLEVQELLNRFEEARLPVAKVQVAAEGARVGEIHEFNGEPMLVNRIEDISEGGYDAALLLSPVTDLQALTRSMVMGNTPLIDMANQFDPGDEIPVIMPDVPGLGIQKLPMVCIVPTGLSHLVNSILYATRKVNSWSNVTVFAVQGVSRQGSRQGLDELFDQTRAILGFKDVEVESFPYQTAFNAFHVAADDFKQARIPSHARYISGNPELTVAFDCAWSSFFVGMIGSAWFYTSDSVDPDRIRSELSADRGFRHEDPFGGALSVVGSDEIIIGGLRVQKDDPNRLTLRFGMDNLRRGLTTTVTRLFKAVWAEESS